MPPGHAIHQAVKLLDGLFIAALELAAAVHVPVAQEEGGPAGLPFQPACRFQLVDAFKGRQRRGRHHEGEVMEKGVMIGAALQGRVLQKGHDLRGEQDALAGRGVVERFLPEAVAHEEKFLVPQIPHGEGERAIEPGQALRPLRKEEVGEDLLVLPAAEDVAALFDLFAQLRPVVEPAVQDDEIPPAGADEGPLAVVLRLAAAIAHEGLVAEMAQPGGILSPVGQRVKHARKGRTFIIPHDFRGQDATDSAHIHILGAQPGPAPSLVRGHGRAFWLSCSTWPK